MATYDDILATPLAPKPIRLPGNQDDGVRGYEVGKIDAPKSYPGNPTARPTNILRAEEEYPEVRRDVNVTDIGERNSRAEEQTPSPKRMSYVELFEALNPDKPETPAQRAAREKKEKREAVFSAIGDGISALSNLFFTTQYAPNSYDPSKGMSAKARERFEKLRQEREAAKRAYAEGYIRAASMDDANNRDNRNWRHQLEREAIADKRAEAKEQREDRKAELNELMWQAKYALQQGKLTEQGYRNTIAEVKAGLIEELTEAQINRLNRGGGGSRKYYGTLLDENGNPVDYYSRADYDKALSAAAMRNDVQPVRTLQGHGGDRQTDKPKGQMAAEVENSIREKQEKRSAENSRPNKNGSSTTATAPSGKWSNTSKIKW